MSILSKKSESELIEGSSVCDHSRPLECTQDCSSQKLRIHTKNLDCDQNPQVFLLLFHTTALFLCAVSKQINWLETSYIPKLFVDLILLKQSYEIKSPPWTILWFRILGIFSIGIQIGWVFLCFKLETIEIKNNKPRHNLSNVKYRPMAF